MLASACKLELLSTAISWVCIAANCEVINATILDGLKPTHCCVLSAAIWLVAKDAICTADKAASCDVPKPAIWVSVNAAARGGPIAVTVCVPEATN